MTPSTARSSQRLAPRPVLKLALRPSRAAQLALTEALAALAPQVQPGATLVDLGPLAGQETARIASALVRPRTIQLASAPGTDLEPAARRLAAAFPETDVLQAQTGRSGWPLALPPHARRQRIVHVGGAWPWWMGPVTRRAFFSRLRRELRGPDVALISFLPVRDGARIEQAWEAAGPALAELLVPSHPVDSQGRVAVRSSSGTRPPASWWSAPAGPCRPPPPGGIPWRRSGTCALMALMRVCRSRCWSAGCSSPLMAAKVCFWYRRPPIHTSAAWTGCTRDPSVRAAPYPCRMRALYAIS